MMEEEIETQEKFVNIDEVLPYVGEFKKFQWILGAMFCTIMFPSTYQILITFFAGMNPTWRCVENSTICDSNMTFSPQNPLRCSIPRSEWMFTEPRDYSIVTTFDLYCGNAWLNELSTSIIMVGWAIGGAFIIGWVADATGRKKIIYLSISMVIFCAFISSFVTNIYLFIFFRLITGIFISGTNLQMSILLSEFVGSKYRPLAAQLVWCCFPLSLCVLTLKAYFIRSWTTLFIVCSVPYSFVILFYKYSTESPRWLRLHGRMEELMKTYEIIARCNKKNIPPHIRISPAIKDPKTNPLHLFRTRNIILINTIVGYAHLAHGMVYYGLSLEARNFGGSPYLIFFLLSVIDIPAAVFSIFACHKYGRKRSTIIGVVSAGVVCITLVLIPMEERTARVILGMFGKFCITMSFSTVGIWSIELYPTTLRAQAIGLINIATRIGAGAAPFVVTGFKSFYTNGSYICMGILAVVCAGLLLIVNETKGLSTLETEEDLRDKPVESVDRPFLNDSDQP